MTEKVALPPELRPWREHVCACQASGQTMVAYAKSHRLSVQAFYRAKARLMRYGADQRPPSRSVFQRVEVGSRSALELSRAPPERGGRGARGGGSGARSRSNVTESGLDTSVISKSEAAGWRARRPASALAGG